MEKQKSKFRHAVETAAKMAAVFVVSAGLLFFIQIQVQKSHTTHYSSAVAVKQEGNVIHHSPCVKTDVNVKITKDTVILSINSDILSGKPVIMADHGVIIVEQADGKRFGIVELYTPGLPETPGNKLLILIEPEISIIMSQRTGCDDIHSYLNHTR